MARAGQIAGQRLRVQRIEGRGLARAADVVRLLVASQAQDFAGARALALRTRGATDAAVEREFDRGQILCTHLLRPTWHFVTPRDIRWLLALRVSTEWLVGREPNAPRFSMHVKCLEWETNCYWQRQEDVLDRVVDPTATS